MNSAINGSVTGPAARAHWSPNCGPPRRARHRCGRGHVPLPVCLASRRNQPDSRGFLSFEDSFDRNNPWSVNGGRQTEEPQMGAPNFSKRLLSGEQIMASYLSGRLRQARSASPLVSRAVGGKCARPMRGETSIERTSPKETSSPRLPRAGRRVHAGVVLRAHMQPRHLSMPLMQGIHACMYVTYVMCASSSHACMCLCDAPMRLLGIHTS